MVGVAQHGRVEPHPSRDHEAAAADGAEVDAAAPALKGDLEGIVKVVGDVEVGRDQVARPQRKHRQRHLGAGQGGGTRHHRPVATGRDDQVRALADGVLGQTLPAVLRVVSSQMSFLPVSSIA